jgi:hypothetical protein
MLMKRGIIKSLAALTLWGSVGLNFAAAQFGTLGQAPPRPRPTVSPFINLRGGAGTIVGQGSASSYYGIIRPQLDANRSIADLQQGINRLNPDGSLRGQLDSQGAVNALGGLETGHAATFFNYSHYYPLVPPGGSGGSGTGFGAGLGGYNPALAGSGFGIGGIGPRTFFAPVLNQPLIRP